MESSPSSWSVSRWCGMRRLCGRARSAMCVLWRLGRTRKELLEGQRRALIEHLHHPGLGEAQVKAAGGRRRSDSVGGTAGPLPACSMLAGPAQGNSQGCAAVGVMRRLWGGPCCWLGGRAGAESPLMSWMLFLIVDRALPLLPCGQGEGPHKPRHSCALTLGRHWSCARWVQPRSWTERGAVRRPRSAALAPLPWPSPLGAGPNAQ
jgi:hypothetical protein